MITTMDSAGRLVIPKEIRESARLSPGQPLDVRFVRGRVEIEPAPLKVRFVKKGALVVAVPESPVEPLDPDVVEETRERLQRERG